MVKAVFDGVVIAESDDVHELEGMTYFPRSSVNQEALVESATTSRCPWKGHARYWNVVGQENTASDAAFAYDKPLPAASDQVADRVAFWNGVKIEK